jgi:hypothetical protein
MSWRSGGRGRSPRPSESLSCSSLRVLWESCMRMAGVIKNDRCQRNGDAGDDNR